MSARERILHSMTRSDAVRRAYGACRSIPVLGSGLRRVVHAAMPMGTRLWIRIPEGEGAGMWMYVDPRTEIGYGNGDHEPWIQDVLKTELPVGGCFYDVGAHSGFFCFIAARCAGPSGAVVAIEADSDNCNLIRMNVTRNHLGQIILVEAAVWSSSGQVGFRKAAVFSNRTQGSVLTPGDLNSPGVAVRAVRLDDLVFSQGFRAPDLLKVDIEGGEWEALQGAHRILTEVKPKVVCEIHDPGQMGKIWSHFQRLGYETEEWKPVHPRYRDYHQVYLWAVPRSA